MTGRLPGNAFWLGEVTTNAPVLCQELLQTSELGVAAGGRALRQACAGQALPGRVAEATGMTGVLGCACAAVFDSLFVNSPKSIRYLVGSQRPSR